MVHPLVVYAYETLPMLGFLICNMESFLSMRSTYKELLCSSSSSPSVTRVQQGRFGGETMTVDSRVANMCSEAVTVESYVDANWEGK